MSSAFEHKNSPYIHHANSMKPTKINLATSGIHNMALSEFGLTDLALDLNGSNVYGYAPLLEALASRSNVKANQVVTATGTSMANHLVMATILNRGDDVLIEHPTYSPLHDIALYLGANVKSFRRQAENKYRVDPDDVATAITSRTKLIVITNLHNPSGVRTPDDVLREVGLIAAKAGAHVLVDEVYMESLFDTPWKSAVHLGPQFITTSSLTKAYGLTGLRCGWIVCDAQMALRLWEMNNLFGSTGSFLAEQASVLVLDRLSVARDRARVILSANRSALNEFLSSASHITTVYPDHGTIVFPRLAMGNVENFINLLRGRYDVSVASGTFFGDKYSFRLGLGEDPAITREGLIRISEALMEFSNELLKG